jgi:hypothetical protein
MEEKWHKFMKLCDPYIVRYEGFAVILSEHADCAARHAKPRIMSAYILE